MWHDRQSLGGEWRSRFESSPRHFPLTLSIFTLLSGCRQKAIKKLSKIEEHLTGSNLGQTRNTNFDVFMKLFLMVSSCQSQVNSDVDVVVRSWR